MRRAILRTSLMALTVLLAFSGVQPHPSHAEHTPTTAIPQNAYARVSETYGQLPMHFEANQGQFDDRVDFLTRGSGYTLFLTGTEAVFSLRAPVESTPARGFLPAPDDLEADHTATQTTVLRMQLVGGSPNPQVRGAERLPGIINYFIGNDPDRWVTDIPTYGAVDYLDVYPGINLRYYGSQTELQYDFIVQPGADPSVIRLRFQNAETVELDANGDLLLGLPGGVLRQHAPFTYQDLHGEQVEVGSRFVLLDGGQVGFALDAYDRSRPLVIDPELVYSTYLGGSLYDRGKAIAVDSSGAAYIAGNTESTDFPTQNPYQANNAGGRFHDYDVFVTKLAPDGSSLVYSTYLGGSGSDYCYGGIAVDSSGAAYIAGGTSSSDFPTQNPYQGDQGGSDAFVTKLAPDGRSLVYSTYLGGSELDRSSGIAVDGSGAAYVTGCTCSTDFPTTPGAFQVVGGNDAFVTKLAPDGSSLVYSTYLGGGSDYGEGIAVDSSGAAYVTGEAGPDFPTTPGAFQVVGGNDAFVTKLAPDGSSLVYSTYLGGDGWVYGESIAVDSSGAAYVTGFLELSYTFPITQNAYQTSYVAGVDAFVTKLAPDGSSLDYSTYMFGISGDIAVDSSGAAYITGGTWSPDFPTTQNAYQATYQGSKDAFVTKLAPDGSSLAYSTYLGGGGSDWSSGIALDSSGAVYVVGGTQSTDFPTTPGAFQTTRGGGGDAFVAKFILAPTIPVLLSPEHQAVIRDTTPRFDWEDSQYAPTQYRLEVDDDPDFASPVLTAATATSTYVTETALSDGQYYWHVRAGDAEDNWSAWSERWWFRIDTQSPSRPVLQAPAYGSTINDATSTFNWRDSRGQPARDQVRPVRYQVQVDNNPNFASPVFIANPVGSQYTSRVVLDDGRYFWRVRARDAAGNWSAWSTRWWFRLDTRPPARPALQTPANQSITGDHTPTFDWRDVTSATRYQLQVDNNGDFASPVFTANTTISRRVSPVTLADGRYYWHVRARDAAGNWSIWSVRWWVIVDTRSPSRPVLLAPANRSITGDNTPTFDWRDVTGATRYQIELDNDPDFSSPALVANPAGSQYTPQTALGDDLYYWHVRARDAVGNWSAWSTRWWVMVQQTAPGTTVINEVQIAGPDAVELLNTAGHTVNLSGWQVLNYDERGRLYATYTFPDGFTLEPGAYVTVHESVGRDTTSDLYTGANLWWEPEGGAVALTDGTVGVDFVRWGGSLVEPTASGNAWSGSNPLGPRFSQTLGRALNSIDSDRGQDWCRQAPSFGAQNGGCLEPVTIPDNVPADGCFEEVHPLWTLHGDWQPRSSDTASSGEYLVYTFGQTDTDAYAEFHFAGSGFALVYHKSPFGGFANVYVDDLRVPYAQLDMYAASETWQREAVFTVSGLDPTVEHVLRVAPTGHKNVHSRGYAIYIDRVDLPVFNAYREGGCFFIHEEDLPQ